MENFTNRGKCSENCGKCCTPLLPLDFYEIKKIKEYIVKNKIAPEITNFERCPFLDSNFKCKIYKYRPDICREFICNSHIKNFKHDNKQIIDFWREFFPEYVSIILIDRAKELNMQYQLKKMSLIK